MRAESGFYRGVAEGTVPVVDQQLIRRGFIHLGMTVVIVTEPVADGFVIEIPFQVVEDDQIEQAVVVYVDPGPRNRPQRTKVCVGLVESGLRAYVGEGSVTVVVIERVVINPGDE